MSKRNEYKEELKWNTKDLYNNIEAFEKDYHILEKWILELSKYKGNILKSSKSLYDCLEFDTKLNQKLEHIYIYAHLRSDEDTTNTKYQSLFGRVHNLYLKYEEASSYIVPEILKKDYELIEKYIKEEPKLKKYERSLKEIFKVKNHILSDKEEELLSKISKIYSTPDDVYSLLTDADMQYGYIKDENNKKIELTEKNYRNLIESTNRKVRKDAFNKLFTTYSNFKNTYASLLASEVKKNNSIANIRKYKSARAASLYRNDIPENIYDNLINTVKKKTNLKSIIITFI